MVQSSTIQFHGETGINIAARAPKQLYQYVLAVPICIGATVLISTYGFVIFWNQFGYIPLVLMAF